MLVFSRKKDESITIGSEIEIKGYEHLILRESEVLGIVG